MIAFAAASVAIAIWCMCMQVLFRLLGSHLRAKHMPGSCLATRQELYWTAVL